MYAINCTIEGMVDCMWDRFFNPEELESPKKHKGKDAWKNELIKKLYVDKKGVYCPADNLRMMLIGNKCRIGAANIVGNYMETNKGKRYLSFCEAFVWVIGPDDNKKVYFEPRRKTFDDYDERSIPIDRGARRVSRRPLIRTPWQLSFIIHVMDEQYDEGKIREFFEVAGMRCGIGAYGPTFGRFRIVKWEVVKEQSKKKKAS